MWLIKRLSSSKLVRGSILIFTASHIVSIANFLYNLLMARLLGPEKYGELGAILSLMILLGAPLSVLNLLVVKTVSFYWGKKEIGTIAAFLKYLTRKLFIIGIIAGLIIVILNPLIISFLKLDSSIPIFLIAFSYIFSGPIILNRATLQGTLSFSPLVLNSFIEVGMKLILSVTLVLLSFQVTGAILGPIIGSLIAYALAILQIKVILKESNEAHFAKEYFFSSVIPVFMASFSLSAIFSIDVLLVKHFFSARIAGEYLAVATIGRIIFYAVGPMIAVMLPIVSSRVSNTASRSLPLLGTMVLSLALSTVIMFVYFLFPKFITGILFGNRYYGIIPYLGMFSFFITIYTINSILTHFLLSVSYYKPIYLTASVTPLQAVGIILFHNSLWDVIWVNIIASLVYCLIISFFVWKKEEKIFIELLYKLLPRGIYAK